MLVFLAFGIKLLSVVALARVVRPFCRDAQESLLAGWVLATAVVFAAMMALSAASILTAQSYWAALAAGGVIAGAALRRGGALPLPPPETHIVLAVFGAFWLLFAARALLFPDFTWDAKTYGLVRIALWMNYASVFVDMPTPQINIFANEWNGELLGLFYGLASDDIQGPIFANAEVLLFAYCSCAWLARSVGASQRWAYAIAAPVVLCPVSLGVATTIKGDLLAGCAFVLATGWFLRLRRKPNRFGAIMLAACLALTVGAKILSSLFVAILAISSVALFGIGMFASLRTILPAASISAIFLARYIANAVQYGNPFHRPPGEAPEPGLATLLANLELLWRSLGSFSMHEAGAPQLSWQLSGGFGALTVGIAAALAAIIVRRRKLPWLLLSILSVALAVSCFAIPARIYGLRYFLPVILCCSTILLAITTASNRSSLLVIPLLLSLGNVTYLLRQGEMNAGREFVAAFRALVGKSSMERTLLIHQSERSNAKFAELRLDRGEPLSFAIYQGLDRAILTFAGSRAQNRLYLAASFDAIPSLLRDRRPDFAVLTKNSDHQLPIELSQQIVGAGYVWLIENEALAIAARADRPEARFVGAWVDRSLPVRSRNSAELISGMFGAERRDSIRFRWLSSRVEIDVPMSGNLVCLELIAFGTGRPEEKQIVLVDGVGAQPPAFDLANTNIGTRKSIHIRIPGNGATVRVRLNATMPVTRWPNDGRSIAFGLVVPPRVVPMDSCK